MNNKSSSRSCPCDDFGIFQLFFNMVFGAGTCSFDDDERIIMNLDLGKLGVSPEQVKFQDIMKIIDGTITKIMDLNEETWTSKLTSDLVFLLTVKLRLALKSNGCVERMKDWKEKFGGLSENNQRKGEIIKLVLEKVAA